MVLFLGLAVLLGALRRILLREPDRLIARLIVAGLVAKVAGSLLRFYVIADLYDGRGDAYRYLETGQELAAMIRGGTLPEQAKETGTPFMDFIAGVYVAAAGPRPLVAFIVFGLLAFCGAFLFLQAFRMALPEADHRRYALLVFFLPTMLFWPSSIGKEAWLVLTLGIAAYGAARILRRLPRGYLILALGSAGVYLVRPHMAALFALSFMVAYILRFRDPTVKRGAAAWLLGLVLVGVGTIYAYSTFAEHLPRDESTQGSAFDQVFSETERRTSAGGSEFDSRPVRSPGDFFHAAVTVPFRPFPTEAHNRQAQLASLEGLLFLGLLLFSIPRLRRLPRLVLVRPYVAMASAYVMGFIVAFSNVANFGLLTRQRAQLLPFLIVFAALPRTTSSSRKSEPPVGLASTGSGLMLGVRRQGENQARDDQPSTPVPGTGRRAPDEPRNSV